MLVEARGKVLSRMELIESLWGPNFDPSTSILAVLLTRLRVKLGASASMIRTERGKGYRISNGHFG